MATTRRTFTPEFKLDAIKLAKSNGNIESTARNLGIAVSALHRWIRQHKHHDAQGRPVFIGQGKPALTEQEARIQQLEHDLDMARQERDILKKAVACLDHKTHLTGMVAFSPRNPSEIPIHPELPGRIRS
jgi:transposase